MSEKRNRLPFSLNIESPGMTLKNAPMSNAESLVSAIQKAIEEETQKREIFISIAPKLKKISSPDIPLNMSLKLTNFTGPEEERIATIMKIILDIVAQRLADLPEYNGVLDKTTTDIFDEISKMMELPSALDEQEIYRYKIYIKYIIGIDSLGEQSVSVLDYFRLFEPQNTWLQLVIAYKEKEIKYKENIKQSVQKVPQLELFSLMRSLAFDSLSSEEDFESRMDRMFEEGNLERLIELQKTGDAHEFGSIKNYILYGTGGDTRHA